MKNIIKFYEKGSVEILYGQSNHSFPLHSHESFCVGVIAKGTALFTINKTKCLLKEDMVFIVPPNIGISINADSEYNYITICFKNELKKIIKNIKFKEYFIKLTSMEEMLTLCQVFEKDGDEIQFLNSMLQLINKTMAPTSELEQKQPNKIVMLICEYIKKNADKKFSLEELAASFYLSKFHLIRIFKKEMGVTPYQYYIQAKIRIIKAKVFHAGSETCLAMDLNLSDQSHLCKLFKKQMGISIQDYKKNLIKK